MLCGIQSNLPVKYSVAQSTLITSLELCCSFFLPFFFLFFLALPVLFVCVVKAWSAITGGVVYNLRRQAQPVYSIAPSPTGDYIATGSLGGYVSVWSLHDGSLVHESKGGTTIHLLFSLPKRFLCINISPYLHPLLTLPISMPSKYSLSGGDTFDVSWSHDEGMLCACFSSGNHHIYLSPHLPLTTSTYLPPPQSCIYPLKIANLYHTLCPHNLL